MSLRRTLPLPNRAMYSPTKTRAGGSNGVTAVALHSKLTGRGVPPRMSPCRGLARSGHSLLHYGYCMPTTLSLLCVYLSPPCAERELHAPPNLYSTGIVIALALRTPSSYSPAYLLYLYAIVLRC
jgi:hypothetical protein